MKKQDITNMIYCAAPVHTPQVNIDNLLKIQTIFIFNYDVLYFSHWQLLFVCLMVLCNISHLVPELIQVSGVLPGLLRLICGFGGLLLLTISHSALCTLVVSFQISVVSN